jgi:hypothetical protein
VKAELCLLSDTNATTGRTLTPISDQRMRFMLGPAATLQIHFIDSIASADVESDACRLTREPSNTTVMDIGNAADRRNDQP